MASLGLVEITHGKWPFLVNAINLLNQQFFASCLDPSDCFNGAPCDIMGTLGFSF